MVQTYPSWWIVSFIVFLSDILFESFLQPRYQYNAIWAHESNWHKTMCNYCGRPWSIKLVLLQQLTTSTEGLFLVYGWRSAEVINLSRMREGSIYNIYSWTTLTVIYIDFPNTQQIFLEENYRSTASILRSCLAIVAEGSPLVLWGLPN